MYASLIPGILFGLIGLYIIFWFGRKILGQFFGPFTFSFKDLRKKRILKDSDAALQSARTIFGNGQTEQALESLKSAFIFQIGPFDYEMISRITSQHMACLHLLLEIGDKQGVRLEDLPILEELVQVRSGMLKAYADTLSSLRKLVYKRDSAKAPSWAKNEFKAKEKELQSKLEDNVTSIKKVYVSIGNVLSNTSERHEYH